jgi:hypothetical protein
MFQDSTKAAVAEVERGESYLKDRFETYMNDDSVSPDVRSLISSAYSQARSTPRPGTSWSRTTADATRAGLPLSAKGGPAARALGCPNLDSR